MKKNLIVFLIVFFLPKSMTAQDFWERLQGPPPNEIAGTVETLVPFGKDTVIACLSNGFAVSFDQGRTWTRRTNGLTPHKIWAMAIDSVGTIMIISREDGVFRSTDVGEHWQTVNEGFTPPASSHGGYELWDICYNETNTSWYIASINGLVWKYSNEGDSWNAMLVDSLAGRFTSITAARNGNVIVCGHRGVYTWFRDLAEWRMTADEGRYLHYAGSRLYTTIDWGGYLFSDDNGESWQLKTGGHGLVGHFRIFDLGAAGLFVGGATMLQYGRTYHSPDSGRTWNEINDLSEYANVLYSIVRLPSGVLIAGMGHGMVRSEGPLQQWDAVDLGWQYGTMFDVTLTSHNRIFAAGREGVHFLEKCQSNWVTSLDRGYVTGIMQHSEGPLLADTWPGVLRSTDHGMTWDSLVLGYNQLSFLVEDDRGVLYGGLVDSFVYRSDDAGATWSAGAIRIPQANIRGAVSHSGSLFILTEDAGLFRCDSSLTAVEPLLALSRIGEPYSLSIDGEGHLIASGRNGIYHSENGGRNWQRLPDPEPRTCLPVMTAMDSKGTLYSVFRMYEGQIDYSIYPENLLYRSTDRGGSWEAMPLPQFFQQYSCLEILDDGKLYLASEAEGLFRSRDVVTTVDHPSPPALPGDHEITVWPQPASSRVTLVWPTGTEVRSVLVHDCMGRLVSRRDIRSNRTSGNIAYDVSSFRPGTYLVSLISNTRIIRGKFVVVNGKR